MRQYAIAVAFTLVLASSALAGAKYYVVHDTVGNCAVVDSKPAAHAGMKVIGAQGGYDSKDAAQKALKGLSSKCKGVVG